MTELEHEQHRRFMETKIVLKPKNYEQAAPIKMEVLDKNGKRSPREAVISVRKHYGWYVLRSDCGHLENYNCGDYDHRPQACKEYEMGGEACLNARAMAGLDGHERQIPMGAGDVV